ncbi:unnamed protein product, partial [Pocillopora meandrina]
FTKPVIGRYVLECPGCGVIYRSRQNWFGNKYPVMTVVRTELRHAWPGRVFAKLDGGHAARRFLNHFSHVTDTVRNLGTPSSQAVTNWITDRVAPD